IVTDLPTAAVTSAGVGAYAAATVASPRIPVQPPQQYGRAPGRRRHPAVYTLLTLLVLAVIVAAIFFAALNLGNGQKTVVVPTVIGKSESEATQMLTSRATVPVTQYQATHPT